MNDNSALHLFDRRFIVYSLITMIVASTRQSLASDTNLILLSMLIYSVHVKGYVLNLVKLGCVTPVVTKLKNYYNLFNLAYPRVYSVMRHEITLYCFTALFAELALKSHLLIPSILSLYSIMIYILSDNMRRKIKELNAISDLRVLMMKELR